MARRHGPVARIPTPRRRQVHLLSAPEAGGQVLVANAANHTRRERNLPATAFLGDGLPSRDGEDHRRQRALVQPAFGRRRVEAYAPGMLDPTRLAGDWSDADVVEMHTAMQRRTLAIVARAIFDVDPQEQGDALGAAFGVLLADRRRAEASDRGDIVSALLRAQGEGPTVTAPTASPDPIGGGR